MQLQNPYLSRDFTWLRGNLHTHTTFSDGMSPPEEVIAAYERQDHDFLAISDHDKLVPPGDYQALTRMTLLAADEATRHGPHILCVQIREAVAPDADRQKVLDDTGAQGGFAVLNHPNWQKHFNHFPQELMERLTGYAGVEIYNGVIERLEGNALATDRWDRLLASGRRVWGYANDDSHRPGDIGRGWNVVQAADRGAGALCQALRQGRFYASTGVDITRIEVTGGAVSITAPNAQRIRFLGAWGKEFYYVDASQAEYEVTGEEGGYVRVECYGEGSRTAWTQPFFFQGETL
jgi:histidinol phosphatase-like PHP family hydrolase